MQIVLYEDEDETGRFGDLHRVLAQARLRVVAVVRDPGAFAMAVQDRRPDCVVAAIGQAPFARSIDRLEWVFALVPCLIITTTHHAEHSEVALRGGPAGYLSLPVTAHEIRAAICAPRDHLARRVHPGAELTATEAQIMNLVAAGHRNSDIAKALNMSLGTVKNRLFSAYCRLQAPNRAAAVTAWLRTGAAATTPPLWD